MSQQRKPTRPLTFNSTTDIVKFVRLNVHTILKIHIVVFSVRTSCDPVGGYQRFRSEVTSILKMEPVYSSKTRISTCKATRCHNPKYHNIYQKLYVTMGNGVYLCNELLNNQQFPCADACAYCYRPKGNSGKDG
jgi:hypothetical protein